MRATTILASALACFTVAAAAVVWIPNAQIGKPVLVEDPDVPGLMLPPPRSGLADLGRSVYAANGCVYCHSQQVGEPKATADVERNWGGRRTVPQDYADTKYGFIGANRIGPDLSNLGTNTAYTEQWYYQHLYDPTSAKTDAQGRKRRVAEFSICPPKPYLFTVQPIGSVPNPHAVRAVTEPGYEVVPNAKAKALAAYLASLNRSYAKPVAAPAAP